MTAGHTTARVFISYRRDDAAAEAGRLRGDVADELGPGVVFQDVDMTAGTEYPAELDSQLQDATILLAVINKSWLFAQDEFGRRRLDLDGDWVRREIRIGLERKILVVPVLIDGTPLPPAEALPEDIAPLAKRQVFKLRNNNWEQDLVQLINEIVPEFAADTADLPDQHAPANPGHLTFGSPPLVVADFRDRTQLDNLGDPELTVVSALHGIGGVGKSQIAAKYFHDHANRFDRSAWVDMRDSDGLTDYGNIANTLGLDIANGVAEAVTTHLRQSPQTWLIVFDNVIDPTQIRPLLPGGDRCKVLITSRYRNWKNVAPNQVNVDVFGHDTAVEFLRQRAGRPGDPGADELAKALGRLPLALALVAALCSEQSLSFDYYREHKMPAAPIAAMNPDNPGTYDRAIKALWSESLAAVEHLEPQAVALMELLSVLDWTSIGRRWLTAEAPSHIGDIDRCLGLLNSYSLIELEDTELSVRHNLLATGIAEDANTERLSANLVELFANSLPEVSADQQTAEKAAEPIRHLQRLLFDRPGLITEPLIYTTLNAADQLNRQGSTVSTFHEATRALCNHLLGSENPLSLTASHYLGWSYWQAGRNSEAIDTLEASLAERERLLGEDNTATLASRSILATSYLKAGRTDEAIPIFAAVLTEQERILGPDHPSTLNSRAELAYSYRQAGRTGEAIAIQEAVLTDYEQVLGPEHPETLMSRANLAFSYQQAGRTDEAIALNEAVLNDRKRVLGPDHPDTLLSRANLAASYRQAGRTDEAITIEEAVLTDSERILGPDHPSTLNRRANLAASYRQAGRTDEAITIEEAVLTDYERILGPEHPDTINSRANLAYSYRQAGRTDEAITIFEAVLTEQERILGPDHPSTRGSRANLAYSYRQAGRDKDADKLEQG